MVRSMMSYSILPISFWGYALNTAIHLLNLVPSKFVPKTPMELWSGRKPSMKYLHIWGCPAHVLKGSLISWNQNQKFVCLWVTQKKLGVIYSIVVKIIKFLLVQMLNSWKMTICLILLLEVELFWLK